VKQVIKDGEANNSKEILESGFLDSPGNIASLSGGAILVEDYRATILEVNLSHRCVEDVLIE